VEFEAEQRIVSTIRCFLLTVAVRPADALISFSTSASNPAAEIPLVNHPLHRRIKILNPAQTAALALISFIGLFGAARWFRAVRAS